ncbi:MAG: AAA family ATPase, partial [Cyanobacteria bacterium P01_F01_bin.53]
MAPIASIDSSTFPSITGYSITEQIYQGSRTSVYRAVQLKSQQSVVIKTLQAAYPSLSDLVQFRNQYTITQSLPIPGIAQSLSLESWQNSYALVMEDFQGVSLQQYVHTHSLSLPETLAIAIQMADILNDVSQHHVIHKDIKPANIIIEPNSQRIQLIDFSIASILPRETQGIQNPSGLEGTLAYLSPEQTGRMNRGIDYRTDFYGLGVTLYELLTGRLPFQASDPMELVHCHLARTPTSPHQINSALPPILSAIVLKLMAKNAEDRYQSALGLKHDLAHCLSQWKETQTIADFELGQQDVCDRFLIPEKLYGRQIEIQALLEAFTRISQPPADFPVNTTAPPMGNSAEIIMVAGFSGIGKTAVINEVHKPITQQHGYFIEGKFDQFNRNIPLSAFVQALQNLINQVLSESDHQLSQWRSKILKALGENSQVLIEVIPALEKVIGPQPAAPELSGSAAQTRFNRLFHKFIAVFATVEHPLVMFLDDLQWADAASLQLIELLMEDTQHLLLLGAYRDNEVSSAHPLLLTMEALKAAEITISTLTLTPLPFDELNQLVADTLHCPAERSRPLSELICHKTQGNPFFTAQFLKALYEDGSIRFNPAKGQWGWDIDQVTAMSLSEDVVAFMAQQLQKLPEATQEILKLAACVGNQFDLATLAIVCKKSMARTSEALWPAMQEGLISTHSDAYKFYYEQSPKNDTIEIDRKRETTENIAYRFLHDRIQQAAYSLIPQAQKQATHYSIGQLLLSKISSAAKEERIFELTNQLNQGIVLIAEQPERDELAELNLTACRKARASIAYQAGQAHAQIGIQLLGEEAWQRQYEMALAFHNLAIELAWFCGDIDSMERSFSAVIAQARHPFEQITAYRIKTRSKTAQNKPGEAISVGKEILEKLGITFPSEPAPDDIQQAMKEVGVLIGDRKIESLVDLPEITDSEQRAIIDMAMDISPAAYLAGSPLYPLLIALAVKRSIQYGNAPRSPHSYASYGLLTCYLAKAIPVGVAYGNLAQQLITKLDAKIAKADTLVVTGMFLTHRSAHVSASLPILRDAYSAAVEVGNLAATGYAAAVFCSNAFWCAQPLSTLERESAVYTEELEKLKLLTTANWCLIYQQSMLNLLEETEQPSILSGRAFVEADFLLNLLPGQDLVAQLFFYLNKLMLSYLFGETESAQTQATEVRKYLGVLPGVVEEAVFYFYDSLAALASLTLPEPKAALEAASETVSETALETSETQPATNTDTSQAEVLERVAENQAQLKQHWAAYAPMNHQHKVDLVEAEKCRILGQRAEAIERYDQAITSAKSNDYLQEAALANELAAKFYLAWGKEKVATGYMQEAYYGYIRWGAKAKVAHLEQTYPQLLGAMVGSLPWSIAQPNSHLLTKVGTFSTNTVGSIKVPSTTQTAWLDMPSAMKAAQAISQETGLEPLLTTLMKIVLENAGAQTGHFILSQDNQWMVVAQAEQTQSETQSKTLSIMLDHYTKIPRSVVYSVARTQETAVFENLNTVTQFAGDTYIITVQPKSVLCLPVSQQGQLVGILYLENNLTTGAFTRNRIELLQLLTSQAAISIENARLYQQTENYSQTLEAEVANKTQALNQKAEDLEQVLKDLKKTQAQLVHTAKMSSMGQMVAGVAHEINNPINFIEGNLKYTRKSFGDLLSLLALYDEKCPQLDPEIEALREDIDLDFLVEDTPKVLDSMLAGSNRISQIVLSLRNFSRLDESGIKTVDLHSGLDSTLLMLKNRLQTDDPQREIQVVQTYGDLPLVTCNPGQLNQVFLNILNNAIDAIQANDQARVENPKSPEIKIRTEMIAGDSSGAEHKPRVRITIANTGYPIAPEIQDKIFEPF